MDYVLTARTCLLQRCGRVFPSLPKEARIPQVLLRQLPLLLWRYVGMLQGVLRVIWDLQWMRLRRIISHKVPIAQDACCKPLSFQKILRSCRLVTFGTHEKDEISLAASEGRFSPSEADDSCVQPSSGIAALSEKDTKMVDMLSWAAVSIGLEWSPPQSAHSWMIGIWGRSMTLSCAPPRCMMS